MADPFREGQLNALETAMTALCPLCLRLTSTRTSTGSPWADGQWKNGDIRTGVHVIDRKPRRCRAVKLIFVLGTVRSILGLPL